MSDKAWLVRDISIGNLKAEYSLFICCEPPRWDERHWWVPKHIGTFTARSLPDEVIEYMRPDLTLPPGGGPVKVTPTDYGTCQVCKTHVGPGAISLVCGLCWNDKLCRLIAERDALLAIVPRLVAAMKAYEMDVDEEPPCQHRKMVVEAERIIAACNEKP